MSYIFEMALWFYIIISNRIANILLGAIVELQKMICKISSLHVEVECSN